MCYKDKHENLFKILPVLQKIRERLMLSGVEQKKNVVALLASLQRRSGSPIYLPNSDIRKCLRIQYVLIESTIFNGLKIYKIVVHILMYRP